MRWIALAAVCGCGGSIEAEGDYAEARAQAECGQLERCSRGYFDTTWPSEKDCVDDFKKQIGQVDDQLQDADCDYQADEAGLCVSRLKGLSCAEYTLGYEAKACDIVWDCGGGGTQLPPYSYEGGG